MSTAVSEQPDDQANASSVLERFIIFPDGPLFGEGKDLARGEDVFNHEAFADTIFKLLARNKPPLSIGLFGSWGIGKSTILNILSKKISGATNAKLKFVYFNAWKYSGDSFRRQFLFELARQIYGGQHDEVTRIQRLNYSEVLKKTHQNSGLAHAISRAIRDAFDLKLAFRGTAVARLILGCLSVLLCVAAAGAVSRWSPATGNFILLVGIPAVFVWFSGMKFDEVFVVDADPLYDPKLIFPEQFEEEFNKLAESLALAGRKLVVAIDDIDRCEPATIKDILICTKNFVGHQNCFFIVPCDDETVINIFSEPSQALGYRDEALRKYFNVALRIPPITGTDLVDFANTVARQTGISDEIVQLAVLANCRDARKMKHFLNSLEMKYQVAKAREQQGLMPPIVDENLPELAKTVLIEDAYPNLFKKIVDNPRVFGLLEQAALENRQIPELDVYGLQNWATDFPGLREILDRTRTIKMGHVDVFFPLKSTNTEVRIPRGSELKSAIVEGNSKLVDEIAIALTDAIAKEATADLVADLLDRSKGTFLRNVISAGLRLYCMDGFFAQSDALRVGRKSLDALLYSAWTAILTLPASHVLRCAKAIDEGRLKRALDAYYDAFGNLPLTPQPPDGVESVISTIYEYATQRKRFADRLNERFDGWCVSEQGLKSLDGINLPNGVPRAEWIPNDALVRKMVGQINAGVTQITEAELLRRKLAFANWQDEYGEGLVRTLAQMLTNSQSSVGYNSVIEFVVSSVVLQPKLVQIKQQDVTDQFWRLLPPLYARLTDAAGKLEVLKAGIIFACYALNVNTQAAARDFVLTSWRTLGDEKLRENLDFTRGWKTLNAESLVKQGIDQEYRAIESELQNPTDRTSERVALCLDHKSLLSAPVDALLIKALDTSNVGVLGTWLDTSTRERSRLEPDFARNVSAKCLELIPSSAQQPERLALILECFTGNLALLSVDDQLPLARKFFSLLMDQNVNTRNAAARGLNPVRKSLSDSHEFKIAVNNALGDIRRDVKTADLLQYRPVGDAILSEPDLLGDQQFEDNAELAKRLLSNSDPAFQEFGVSIVERTPQIPEPYREEIEHLLLSIEKASPTLKERASKLLLRTGGPA